MQEGNIIGLNQLEIPNSAQTALQQINGLYSANSAVQGVILRASLDNPMANPLVPGNTEYAETSDSGLRDYLRNNLRGRVIDIGSGGILELQGIVPDKDLIYLDKNDYDGPNAVKGDAASLSYADNTFDSLYSRNCVSLDPEQLLSEAIRIVKEGGVIVLNISVATAQEVASRTIDILKALRSLGTDIDGKCSFTVINTIKKHQALPLQWNYP